MYINPQDIRNKGGWDEETCPDTLMLSNSFIPLSEAEIEDRLTEANKTYDTLTARQQIYFKEALICLVCSKFCKNRATSIQEELATVDNAVVKYTLNGNMDNYLNLEKQYVDEYEKHTRKFIDSTIGFPLIYVIKNV